MAGPCAKCQHHADATELCAGDHGRVTYRSGRVVTGRGPALRTARGRGGLGLVQGVRGRVAVGRLFGNLIGDVWKGRPGQRLFTWLRIPREESGVGDC